jgi:Fe-S-cluster containining protein
MIAEYRAILERAVSRKEQITRVGKKLKKMKSSSVSQLFLELHERAFEQIDCLSCANCCSSVGPLVNDQDIDRLSKALRMSRRELSESYLTEDEDGDMVFSSLPCPLLCPDNRCLVYESRPKACREYPHTDQRYIHRYIKQTVVNSRHCPAVALMFDYILSEDLL